MFNLDNKKYSKEVKFIRHMLSTMPAINLLFLGWDLSIVRVKANNQYVVYSKTADKVEAILEAPEPNYDYDVELLTLLLNKHLSKQGVNKNNTVVLYGKLLDCNVNRGVMSKLKSYFKYTGNLNFNHDIELAHCKLSELSRPEFIRQPDLKFIKPVHESCHYIGRNNQHGYEVLARDFIAYTGKMHVNENEFVRDGNLHLPLSFTYTEIATIKELINKSSIPLSITLGDVLLWNGVSIDTALETSLIFEELGYRHVR